MISSARLYETQPGQKLNKLGGRGAIVTECCTTAAIFVNDRSVFEASHDLHAFAHSFTEDDREIAISGASNKPRIGSTFDVPQCYFFFSLLFTFFFLVLFECFNFNKNIIGTHRIIFIA